MGQTVHSNKGRDRSSHEQGLREKISQRPRSSKTPSSPAAQKSRPADLAEEKRKGTLDRNQAYWEKELRLIHKQRQRYRKRRRRVPNRRRHSLSKSKLLVGVFSSLFFLAGVWLHLNVAIHPIKGRSMQPALLDGQYVLVQRTEDISRYAVISFTFEEEAYVKRIIGTPGDAIRIVGWDTLCLDMGNQGAFTESYSLQVTDEVAQELATMMEIPPQHYFVVGDNIDASNDSRQFGLVPLTAIEGEVMYCVYPFFEIGRIR